MLTVEQFRDRMRSRLEEEKRHEVVEVWGSSIEEALREASVELQTPVHFLEYSVLIKGYRGLFGVLFKKEWRLAAHPSPEYIYKLAHKGNASGAGISSDFAWVKSGGGTLAIQPVDGKFGVRCDTSGQVFMKVCPAVGDGRVVVVSDIMEWVSKRRGLPPLNAELVGNIVAKAAGQWQPIAEYDHVGSSDSEISVAVNEDEMRATITLSYPGNGGATPRLSDLKSALLDANITFGIEEEALLDLEAMPVYRTPVVAARGRAVQNGSDADIRLLFDEDLTTAPLEVQTNGSVDLKSYNRIHNVRAGEAVAKIIPSGKGEDGMDVRGKVIPAKDGKDQLPPLGGGVTLSENGLGVIATTDGQALKVKGVVSVETIKVVDGDVRSHIDFFGTIIINGSVEDGYDIKAQGDIQIAGSVGRSRLTAGGNIYVDRGINGNIADESSSGEATPLAYVIKCGKSLWASFIQNGHVEAGEFVIVSDGIVNSDVKAAGKILCKGKRAAIIGGHVCACSEINAVSLGSTSGTPTTLEVGANPIVKEELVEVKRILESLEIKYKEEERALHTITQSARGRPLPPERQRRLDEMQAAQDELKIQLDQETARLTTVQEEYDRSKVDGKISASRRVNAGVVVYINEIEYAVTTEYDRAVTFTTQDGLVQTGGYQIITDDINRKGGAGGH